RFVERRIQDADLRSVLADRTHVFHLAAQAGVRKSWGTDFGIYTTSNVEASQVLLEACVPFAGQTLQKFVYASSSSVYGDGVEMPMKEDAMPQPVSPYGVTKLAAEHLCNLYCSNHGVPAVSLRYFTVYGPRQRPDMGFHRFLRATIRNEPITLYGDGEQTRDFTFVSDAVCATIAAAEHDKFLFDKGTEALNKKKWLTAREFFKQVTETYTQSPYRPDSKIGIGDTYLGEGTAEALVLAINEFKEFLAFYPTNARADYAQYKLGICHYKQMRAPQRAQSETRDAMREIQAFVNRYPDSPLTPDARTKLREPK